MNGKRALAWRNLMVAAINVALERGLIDLDPGAEVEAARVRVQARRVSGPRRDLRQRLWRGRGACRLLPTERGAELVRSFGPGSAPATATRPAGSRASPAGPGCRPPSRGMFRCRRDLLPLVAAVGGRAAGLRRSRAAAALGEDDGKGAGLA